MNLIVRQINHGLIKEENFAITLCKNGISVYSIHNEGNSVIAEWFVEPLKAKIYKN